VNQLLKKFPQEIKKILAKYPPDQKRASVMPLLHLAQQDRGYISRETMAEIAEIAEVEVTEVASVVGFYTLFHTEPGGKIRIQVCTDIACALRGSREYLDGLCAELDIKPGGTTPDGLVTVEEVKCLAACDRAPMFQSQMGDELEYHEHQTVARTMDWLRSMMASLRLPESDEPLSPEPEGGDHE